MAMMSGGSGLEITGTFRREFIASITSTHTQDFVPQVCHSKVSLRTRLAKVKVLRKIYKFVQHSFFLKSNRLPSPVLQLPIVSTSLDTRSVEASSIPKIFVAVPYFLEMNGPSSHYGDLLEICKTLNLEVNYVATEKSFIEDMSNSSYRNFVDINLIGPESLRVLFSSNAIVINCGSPWIYRNIDGINASGGLVIDYLFNHVGHTWSNYHNRAKIFHTVCQHQKLLQVLQESTDDPTDYSCIPIPFPEVENSKVLGTAKNVSPLWVGRLSPEKGVDRLIDIASGYFKNSGKPIRVIGDGPLRMELKHGVRDGSINYLGKLSHIQTLSEIASSKVVVNTSYIEGVSLVAMEALASEVYVISFDIGGMSELLWHPYMNINHGDNKDFIELLLYLETFQPSKVETIPEEFLKFTNVESWRNLIISALKCLGKSNCTNDSIDLLNLHLLPEWKSKTRIR
jgi:glycosyltransferase involved in cell wall biosynthesis